MASKKKAPTQEAQFDLAVRDQEEFDNLWVVQALRMVHGAKEQEHGHPYATFSRVRAGWSLIAGVELSFTQVCYMMTWHKMSRELTTGGHSEEENNIDGIGYFAVLNRIKNKEAEYEAGRTAKSASDVVGE